MADQNPVSIVLQMVQLHERIMLLQGSITFPVDEVQRLLVDSQLLDNEIANNEQLSLAQDDDDVPESIKEKIDNIQNQIRHIITIYERDIEIIDEILKLSAEMVELANNKEVVVPPKLIENLSEYPEMYGEMRANFQEAVTKMKAEYVEIFSEEYVPETENALPHLNFATTDSTTDMDELIEQAQSKINDEGKEDNENEESRPFPNIWERSDTNDTNYSLQVLDGLEDLSSSSTASPSSTSEEEKKKK